MITLLMIDARFRIRAYDCTHVHRSNNIIVTPNPDISIYCRFCYHRFDIELSPGKQSSWA